MKKCLFLLLMLISVNVMGQEASLTRAGIMSEDFVKARLNNPEEVKFEGGYRGKEESPTKFMVYQKGYTKNDFGVKKSFVYKIHMIYKGGEWEEKDNWTYDLLIIEEANTGRQYKFTSPFDK